MNDRYSQYYQALGIQAGCTWSELKAAYRQLVKTWHPDQTDDENKALAEERTKEITSAFRKLSDYRKKHGKLPAIPSENIDVYLVSDTGTPPDIESNSSDEETSSKEFTPDSWNQQKEPTRVSNLSRIFGVLTISALLVLGYTALEPKDQNPQQMNIEENLPSTNTLTKIEDSTQAQTKVEEIQKKRYFTSGSRLGEVIAVQGIPSYTEENIWYYGRSKVYFENGVVSNWEIDSSNPLKVQTDSYKHSQPSLYFTIGSTMEAVLAAEGAPVIATEDTWDYGLSKVYFKDGRVTDWTESPMRPLKARK